MQEGGREDKRRHKMTAILSYLEDSEKPLFAPLFLEMLNENETSSSSNDNDLLAFFGVPVIGQLRVLTAVPPWP